MRHRHHSHERGVAAIETALSLVILTFVAMAGIFFTDAMVVRQRLTTATSRAARVCAVSANAANIGNCIQQQVRAGMAQTAQRCNPLRVEPTETPLRANLSMVTARVTCGYVNTLANFLGNQGVGEEGTGMTLTAQATMPVAR